MKEAIKIAILGYGLEGRALAKYLIKQADHEGAKLDLTICDENRELTGLDGLSNLSDPSSPSGRLPEHVKIRLGDNAFANLAEFDLIYRSPGIPLSRPELQTALETGAEFSSVTKLFFEKCPCPIIGVSGTKGKGTTSTLIYEILKKAGKQVFLGGNIGEPPLNFLQELTEKSLVVLELSSFQLEDLEKSPHISVVLNITSDHLDYHPTTEEYRKSKQALLKHQTEADFGIINADHEGSKAFSNLGRGKKLFYSTKPQTDTNTAAHLEGENIIVQNEAVAKTSDIALRGAHNLENVLPACFATKLLGVPNETIKSTLRAFQGLPHRLEFVAEASGVKYFNDSFSTTPETSIAAVKSFHEPLYLIAGGSEKHSDFTDWAKVCTESPNLKMVLLMGETAGRMEEALQDALFAKPIVRTENLQAAFEFLKEQVQSGDIVLLSPACASFGLFENYKVRGETFRNLAGSAHTA